MKTGKVIATSVCVFAALLVAAIALAISRLNDLAAYFRPTIERSISEAIGATVAFKEINASLFPPSISILDITVAESESKTVGATIRSIEGRAELIPLLSGQLAISALKVSGPDITVVRSASGASIKGITKTKAQSRPTEPLPVDAPPAFQPTTPTSNSSIELHVDKISIEDGILQVEDQLGSRSLLVNGIDLSSKVKLTEQGVQLPQFNLSFNALKNSRFKFDISDARFTYPSRSFWFSTANLSTPAGTIKASNLPRSADNPLVVEVAGENLAIIELRSIASQLAPSLNLPDLDGSFSGSGKLTLQDLSLKRIDASLSFTGLKGQIAPELKISSGKGTVMLSGSPEDLTCEAVKVSAAVREAPVEASAKIRIRPTQISISDLTLRGLGGSLKTSPTISLSTNPIRVSSPFDARTLSLESLLKLLNNPLAGTLSGTITSFSGDISSMNVERPGVDSTVKGSLLFRDGSIKGLNIPEQLFAALSGLPFLAEGLKGKLPPEVLALTTKKDTAVKELQTAFKLSSGSAEISSLRAVSDFFSISGTGTYAPNGELLLHTQLAIHEQYSTILLKRVPELQGLRDGASQVVIPLTLKGRFPSVKVVPDLATIAKKTSGSVIQKALESVAKSDNKKLKKTLNKILGL